MNAAVFASDESSHKEVFLFHLVASDQITQSLCA